MTDLTGLEDLLLLVIAALIPALLYLTWVRKAERFQQEPWGPLLKAFSYGALFATFLAALLELVLLTAGTAFSQAYPGPETTFLNSHSPLNVFFLALVVAPFVEEGLKAGGVVNAKGNLRLVSDGLVFGASVGLGFGFFETFLYGIGAFLTGGLVAGLGLIFVRSISSVLLHGSTTAMFGYGYTQNRLLGRTGAAGGYYLLAVTMHATFNAIASLGVIVAALGFSSTIAGYADIFGLLLAILFAFAAIEHARKVIQETDVPPGLRRPPGARSPSPIRVQYRGPR